MSNVTFKDVCELADSFGMGHDLIESFAFACRVKNLTPSTLKCYAERLEYLLHFAHARKKTLDELTSKDIQAYVLQIMDTVSAATVNGRIRVYKVFYKHLRDEGLVTVDPMESIDLVRMEQKVKPVLSAEQMSKVLSGISRNTPYGARAYCMILLTYDAITIENTITN